MNLIWTSKVSKRRSFDPFKSTNRTDRIRYIEVSVGRTYMDDNTGEDETDSGTHLIVFPARVQGVISVGQKGL